MPFTPAMAAGLACPRCAAGTLELVANSLRCPGCQTPLPVRRDHPLPGAGSAALARAVVEPAGGVRHRHARDAGGLARRGRGRRQRAAAHARANRPRHRRVRRPAGPGGGAVRRPAAGPAPAAAHASRAGSQPAARVLRESVPRLGLGRQRGRADAGARREGRGPAARPPRRLRRRHRPAGGGRASVAGAGRDLGAGREPAAAAGRRAVAPRRDRDAPGVSRRAARRRGRRHPAGPALPRRRAGGLLLSRSQTPCARRSRPGRWTPC